MASLVGFGAPVPAFLLGSLLHYGKRESLFAISEANLPVSKFPAFVGLNDTVATRSKFFFRR